MPRLFSKITGRGVRQRELTNPHGGRGLGEAPGRDVDSGKVIEGSGKLALHFVLSQRFPQEEVQRAVHPAKARFVPQQLHEQRGRGEDAHAGDEGAPRQELIQTGEEDAERRVRELAREVGGVAIPQLLGDFQVIVVDGVGHWLGAACSKAERAACLREPAAMDHARRQGQTRRHAGRQHEGESRRDLHGGWVAGRVRGGVEGGDFRELGDTMVPSTESLSRLSVPRRRPGVGAPIQVDARPVRWRTMGALERQRMMRRPQHRQQTRMHREHHSQQAPAAAICLQCRDGTAVGRDATHVQNARRRGHAPREVRRLSRLVNRGITLVTLAYAISLGTQRRQELLPCPATWLLVDAFGPSHRWGRPSILICRSTLNEQQLELSSESIDVSRQSAASSGSSSNNCDVPLPTEAGGYTHTTASKAKISAANKGKTPWNKGKARSDAVKARIAEGVRRRNRERFLAKLQKEGITEEEYEARKKEQRRKADAERRARKTAAGGYKPTEETKKKISTILKQKYANGEIQRKPRDPSTVRKGFKHTEETKAKIAETLRRKWAEDEQYREHMTQRTIANGDVRNAPSVRSRIAETLRKRWEDPEFRASMMEKFKTRKSRQSTSKAEEHRRKISEAMKKKWMDEEYRKRATMGMAKQRGDVPPKLVKPVQPKGAVRKVDPLKQTKKKLKKKKKKSATKPNTAAREEGTKIDASSVAAIEPMSATATRKIPTETIEVEEELPEGSIERLRKERKDLYDLLYGDEEEDTAEIPPVEAEDISFTSMILNGSSKSNINVSGIGIAEKKTSGPKPVFSNGGNGGSNLASLLADDDDLDDFDPYGLDNF